MIKKPMDDTWLIWSNEHGAWWGWNHRGYVEKREDAGRYTLDEAHKICHGANQFRGSKMPNEVMVPEYPLSSCNE